jgi:hypothetical protein
MIKWILIGLCTLQWVGIGAMMVGCSQESEPKVPAEVRTVPERDEILYDRDTGDCWVVKRSNDLISETLFHSEDVDDCYKYTIKGD